MVACGRVWITTSEKTDELFKLTHCCPQSHSTAVKFCQQTGKLRPVPDDFLPEAELLLARLADVSGSVRNLLDDKAIQVTYV